jgi:protein gp37
MSAELTRQERRNRYNRARAKAVQKTKGETNVSTKTIIAWTDHTFNPVWGCRKISPGCAHCYAELLSRRYGFDLWGTEKRRVFGPKYWQQPRKWDHEARMAGLRRRVFCGSMMDWCEDNPTTQREISRLWPVIRATPHLDWLLLTKRPERIEGTLPGDWGRGYPNVWLGTSIESDDYVRRADYLRSVTAAVRFISYEPALGPLPSLNLDGIDWLIQGGESGAGFRAMPHEWARQMRDRCRDAGVAYFFKQSAAIRTELGTTLDGQTIQAFPIPRAVGAGQSRRDSAAGSQPHIPETAQQTALFA